jgi:choline dehydrogenase-like flavoprotein
LSLNLNFSWGTGGSAAHHFACWVRLHEDDFAYQSTSGVGLDWPIAYSDLRPYCDQIQAEVGISGDGATDIWTPPHAPYSMPPLPILEQGTALKRGFDALDIPTSPMPHAILSRPMGERAACILDGWCAAGCPIGALANPQVTYLREALLAGATLINDAYVTRVLTNSSGDRAISVEFFDYAGARQRVDGNVIALGAYAIENPRILLNSASSAHPHGLANSSGLVGAYMMCHVGGQVFGLFKDETKPYMGRTGGEFWSQAHYTSAGRSWAPTRKRRSPTVTAKPMMSRISSSLAPVFSRPAARSTQPLRSTPLPCERLNTSSPIGATSPEKTTEAARSFDLVDPPCSTAAARVDGGRAAAAGGQMEADGPDPKALACSRSLLCSNAAIPPHVRDLFRVTAA